MSDMEIEKNSSKTFELNRIFNVFNPRVYCSTIVILLISFCYFIAGVINKEKFEGFAFVPFAAAIILLVAMEVYHRPRKISIYNGYIDFDDHMFLRLDGRNGFWWVKVRYSVSDIYDMEFHQNFIERLFNVGHIYFKGKATFMASRDNDKIDGKDTFTIYGIKSFGEFKGYFK